MNRSTSIVLALILILVVGVGAWLATRPKDDTSSRPSTTQTTPPPATPTPTPPASAAGSTITYDNNGFNPSAVTVKAGQTLTFTNKSGGTIQPSSDPHPQHTDNAELNVGSISKGQSKSVTPSRTGTFGMHDHLNPSHTLTVTVE
ncbi:MAG TPA: hypothetical protein VMR98_02165 [Candidatus Polarisedimenticolaceae bacterium]|nr:hypothetical protein [Candidatus Polarisedimenticolaceae bacterium]